MIRHVLDLCRAEVLCVDLDHDLAGLDIGRVLLDPSTGPSESVSAKPTQLAQRRILELDADCREGALDKLADGVRLAGREDKVFRLGLLEHEPHAFHVVAR
jgi:hypothetical protein